MPYTYEGQPFAGTAPYTGQVIVDTVRFLIGDTDPSDWQLQDGEITGLWGNNANDPYMTAIEACRALVAKYSRQVDKTIGNASVMAEKRAGHYRELRLELQQASVRHGGAPKPWLGGISEAEHETDELNDDLIQPAFQRGMHDNPGGSDQGSPQSFVIVVPE